MDSCMAFTGFLAGCFVGWFFTLLIVAFQMEDGCIDSYSDGRPMCYEEEFR